MPDLELQADQARAHLDALIDIDEGVLPPSIMGDLLEFSHDD